MVLICVHPETGPETRTWKDALHSKMVLLETRARHCYRRWGQSTCNKTEKESCPHGAFLLLGKQTINRTSEECITGWQALWREVSTDEFWGGRRRHWLPLAREIREGLTEMSLKERPNGGAGKLIIWLSAWEISQAEETAVTKALKSEQDHSGCCAKNEEDKGRSRENSEGRMQYSRWWQWSEKH